MVRIRTGTDRLRILAIPSGISPDTNTAATLPSGIYGQLSGFTVPSLLMVFFLPHHAGIGKLSQPENFMHIL